ncbi:unnamed protein product [Peronospora destructor]|uniref:Uncharacterized protein n=1 Tax=Peronospora destructor TaxID=86335 RepID=A0AAV0T1R5_9STRA|nr:unnamed protein product [Peronospora destructor]
MSMVRSMVFGSGLPLNLWDDAAENASYIMIRSPTRGSSPMRLPKDKTLEKGGETGIISKSDETKGYRVLFTIDRVVRTTQHVQNVKTLSVDANEMLIRQLGEEINEETRDKKIAELSDNIAEPSGSKVELDESGKVPGNTNDVGHREERSASSAKVKGRKERKENQARDPRRH